MDTSILDVKMADSKESDYLRDERIFGTNNGATLQTKVIKNKKEYKREKNVNLDEI
jgi:hypothetical protein